MRRRSVLGLGLAAAAAGLWIGAVVIGGPDAWTILSLMTILLGFVLTAWGEGTARTAPVPIGFLVVAVGITLFYRGDLWSSIYNIAGASFAAGAVVAAWGAWQGSVLPQKAGLVVAGLASLLWVYADIGSWMWQPGNMLMVAACWTAAWGMGRSRRPQQRRAVDRAAAGK